MLCGSCRNNKEHDADSYQDSFIYGVDTATGWTRTVASNLSRSREFSNFIQQITDAGLKETLSKPGPFTIFAPTNEAFENSAAENIQQDVSYYMIAGSIEISELDGPRKLKTLSGNDMEIAAVDGGLKINGRKIHTIAINCSNGIIYPVNELLMRPQ
jgi:uncharacterized surface protein with fasciclin (FAS1) repeats